MYAIVDIAGQQFKVAKDQQIFVHRLSNKAGDSVTFDRILFVENDGKIDVGAPAVAGATVTAKVIEHRKGDKVIIFKKKRRKGYQTRNGHRQQFTKIAITGISLDGSKKKAEKAEKPAEKAAPKATKAAAKGDDLKKIEGVGPKIAELINNAGIATYAELAATSVEKLNEILAEAGSAYATHNPETWPTQAQLAADGKWDELKELQDRLDGGVDKA
jgi:large subunit ribosomal protein L21